MSDLKVDYKKFKKVYNIIKKKEMEEISFEFLVGSCFPDAFKNIKEEMRSQYTKGYVDGLNKKDLENKTSE